MDTEYFCDFQILKYWVLRFVVTSTCQMNLQAAVML